MTNINPKTGIAYGVISANSLDMDVVHELMCGSQARDASYMLALDEHLHKVEVAWEDGDLTYDLNGELDYERAEEDFKSSYTYEEPIIEGVYEGVEYSTTWLGGALLFWIFESPHVGEFSQCSPCVPGAADLDSPVEYGVEGYDVPEDWRVKED